MNILPCVVDRNMCEFLSIAEFVSFRKTCKCHYYDEESWVLRSITLPINCPNLNYREKIGLHYLLEWSMHFGVVNSEPWLKSLISWPQSRIAIKIICVFLKHFRSDFIVNLDISMLDTRRQFIWLRRLGHRYPVFKRRLDMYPSDAIASRAHYRDKMYRNSQQCY